MEKIIKIVTIFVLYLAMLSYFYNPTKTNAYFISNKVRSEPATFSIKF